MATHYFLVKRIIFFGWRHHFAPCKISREGGTRMARRHAQLEPCTRPLMAFECSLLMAPELVGDVTCFGLWVAVVRISMFDNRISIRLSTRLVIQQPNKYKIIDKISRPCSKWDSGFQKSLQIKPWSRSTNQKLAIAVQNLKILGRKRRIRLICASPTHIIRRSILYYYVDIISRFKGINFKFFRLFIIL